MQQVEQDIAASMRNYTYLFDLEQVRVDLGDDLELVRVCALLCDGATQSKLCNYLARAWLRNETELMDAHPKIAIDGLVDACARFWQRFVALQYQDEYLQQLVERLECAEGELQWATAQLIKRQIAWLERNSTISQQ